LEIPDAQEGSKVTSVATIDAGVQVRYWRFYGQSSAISGRRGAGLLPGVEQGRSRRHVGSEKRANSA
jgi:hypothetical protein